MEKIDLYKYEKKLWADGLKYVAGVDEVGRGPLIGPVVAACVVLPEDFILEGLTDSKKLTEKKRNIFYDYIIEHAIFYSIELVEPEVIDEINIYQATKLAMTNAIDAVGKSIKLDHVLIDAMKLDLSIPSTVIIKGDLNSITIAAASVLAKVTRDRLMKELDRHYPEYGFKNHKGYPTKKHLEAINKYGLIEGYRKSYNPIKELLKQSI